MPPKPNKQKQTNKTQQTNKNENQLVLSGLISWDVPEKALTTEAAQTGRLRACGWDRNGRGVVLVEATLYNVLEDVFAWWMGGGGKSFSVCFSVLDCFVHLLLYLALSVRSVLRHFAFPPSQDWIWCLSNRPRRAESWPSWCKHSAKDWAVTTTVSSA